MRPTIDRIVTALCAGRPPRVVAERFYVALWLLAGLYAACCIFLALEPRA